MKNPQSTLLLGGSNCSFWGRMHGFVSQCVCLSVLLGSRLNFKALLQKCGLPFQCEKPRWHEMKPMTNTTNKCVFFCRITASFLQVPSIPKRLIKIDQNEFHFLLSNMIFKNIDLLFTVLQKTTALFFKSSITESLKFIQKKTWSNTPKTPHLIRALCSWRKNHEAYETSWQLHPEDFKKIDLTWFF